MERPVGIKDNNPTAADLSSAPPPPWVELPRDLTENILRRLGQKEILKNAEKVCTTWRSVCSEPSLWRVIRMNFSRDIVFCRRAVDRSRGQLIDITIRQFCTDELLHYISERSRCLKCLKLVKCNVSSKGLTASAKNFPELEELHLILMPWITAEDIEVIGISFPKLKSFTFNNHSFIFSDVQIASTIAKYMPNLHHINLYGNKLEYEGLKAIFNGCPNLEYLCLCQCSGSDFQRDFSKKYSVPIKLLKCHS